MLLNKNIEVSIIIPTYNGANKIRVLLNALASQTYNDFELLIVIDGSTDNTNDVVAQSKADFQHLQIINQENKGRAIARNTGATKAKGTMLIFFDDDIDPVSNVVESHIRHHQLVNDSILCGHLLMDNRNTMNDFFQYRHSIEQKWDSAFQDMAGRVSFKNYKFTSQNLSVPRELFLSLNGFDNRLIDSEDFDFCFRALLKQIPVYYDKKIFAWHRDFVDVAGFITRQRAYKHAKSYLLKLHPEYIRLHPRSFEISQKPISSYKYLLSKLFIYNSFWKQVINSSAFLKIIPEKIRFRLYEVIIYSSTLHEK